MIGERGGIVVDDQLHTSEANIFAIGECALHAECLRDLGEARGVARAQRMQFHIGQAGEHLAVLLAKPSEADDSVFEQQLGPGRIGILIH